MPISKVAKRYSKGLFDYALENHQLETVSSEMSQLLELLNQSKDINTFFQNPFIETSKKIEVSKQIFVSFSALSNNFIQLCIKNGREKHIKDIVAHFMQNVETRNGVQRIFITSASELSQNNINDILSQSKIVDHSKKNNVETFVKPDLIGGYIISVGDQQIDSSIKTQLSALKKELQVK